ncbi:hypothetical protein GAGA_0253 [Paraglaciecola agarilytica NO2]|uniref:Uncharacterized protein n=1 Tax=Paraglaciecola agarilytica NO2 TaxID=1125747 RepID=A0ABQ0I1H5_9ALTE|nr:hypothetical protein GAGA_0253 [Paraglaciecola agarilytica NO2]
MPASRKECSKKKHFLLLMLRVTADVAPRNGAQVYCATSV